MDLKDLVTALRHTQRPALDPTWQPGQRPITRHPTITRMGILTIPTLGVHTSASIGALDTGGAVGGTAGAGIGMEADPGMAAHDRPHTARDTDMSTAAQWPGDTDM